MIGIINYGSGNVYAIANLLKRIDIPYILSDNIEELAKASKLILPGVGAFDETMKMLSKNGMKDFLNEEVLITKKPIMGVCVGMQILGDYSEEGNQKGFGWIKGQVKKIDTNTLLDKPHLPHLGWNSIIIQKETKLLKNLDFERGFYFLHSYYFQCSNSDDVVASVDYGNQFACCVNHENVYGVQFHPEKSHSNGIQLFKNFNDL